MTTTCLRCKYSFELQRIQADYPHVEHAMTLEFTVEVSFQLKNRQREPIAWVLYAVTTCTASYFWSSTGDK